MSASETAKARIWVGDRSLEPPPLAPGERLIAVTELSELLVISEAAQRAAAEAVREAEAAFASLVHASDASISAFFDLFAQTSSPRSSAPMSPTSSRLEPAVVRRGDCN